MRALRTVVVRRSNSRYSGTTSCEGETKTPGSASSRRVARRLLVGRDWRSCGGSRPRPHRPLRGRGSPAIARTAGLRERLQHFAPPNPLAPATSKRRGRGTSGSGLPEREVEEGVRGHPARAPDLEQIAEAPGGEDRGPRAPPLEDRVRPDGGAVHYPLEPRCPRSPAAAPSPAAASARHSSTEAASSPRRVRALAAVIRPRRRRRRRRRR